MEAPEKSSYTHFMSERSITGCVNSIHDHATWPSLSLCNNKYSQPLVGNGQKCRGNPRKGRGIFVGWVDTERESVGLNLKQVLDVATARSRE